MSKEFFDGVEWTARVSYLGKLTRVVMSFASEADMEKISAWADYAGYSPSHLTGEQQDILEYASLLGGMYRVYESRERFAGGANRLERIMAGNPREDILFALVMKLPASEKKRGAFWGDEILGFAAMRHTWMNTVKLEFLAVSPFHDETGVELRGVGSALLSVAVQLSEMMSALMFWAESSETSLGFYLKQKFKTLKDIVYLDGVGMAEFLRGKTRRLTQ